MVNVPVRVPEAVGVKVMATVQPVLGGSEVPQVLAEILKSAPATVGVCTVVAVPPVLEMVMFCAELVALTRVVSKVRVMGSRMTAAGGVPVPVSEAVACPP